MSDVIDFKIEKLEDKLDKVQEKTSNKFDKVQENINIIKESVHKIDKDVTELRYDLNNHMELVKEHIAIDRGIVTETQKILVLLPSIEAMAKDYNFKQELAEENKKKIESAKSLTMLKNEKLKSIATKVSIAVSVVALLSGILKFFKVF